MILVAYKNSFSEIRFREEGFQNSYTPNLYFPEGIEGEKYDSLTIVPKKLEYGVRVQMNNRFESIHIWSKELEQRNKGRWTPLVVEYTQIIRQKELLEQYLQKLEQYKDKTYTLEQMIEACKYGYDYHKTTSFPELSFEENCQNNFLQKLQGQNEKI